LREAGPDDTPEELEAERQLAQNFIDTGESLPTKLSCLRSSLHAAEELTDDDYALMEQLKQKGFPDWSRRDFQQLIKGLEQHGWYDREPFVIRS
jgi:SWI/SNF-related matrix-associated actin-dependent regulator of chromatin subfamily A member 5